MSYEKTELLSMLDRYKDRVTFCPEVIKWLERVGITAFSEIERIKAVQRLIEASGEGGEEKL